MTHAEPNGMEPEVSPRTSRERAQTIGLANSTDALVRVAQVIWAYEYQGATDLTAWGKEHKLDITVTVEHNGATARFIVEVPELNDEPKALAHLVMFLQMHFYIAGSRRTENGGAAIVLTVPTRPTT